MIRNAHIVINNEDTYENVPVSMEIDETGNLYVIKFKVEVMDVTIHYNHKKEIIKFEYYHNIDKYTGYIDSTNDFNCYVSTTVGDYFLDVRYMVFNVREDIVDIRYVLILTEESCVYHSIEVDFNYDNDKK